MSWVLFMECDMSWVLFMGCDMSWVLFMGSVLLICLIFYVFFCLFVFILCFVPTFFLCLCIVHYWLPFSIFSNVNVWAPARRVWAPARRVWAPTRRVWAPTRRVTPNTAKMICAASPRGKSKDWLPRNHNNMSDWSYMDTVVSVVYHYKKSTKCVGPVYIIHPSTINHHAPSINYHHHHHHVGPGGSMS
jgi:hypothetical protein